MNNPTYINPINIGKVSKYENRATVLISSAAPQTIDILSGPAISYTSGVRVNTSGSYPVGYNNTIV